MTVIGVTAVVGVDLLAAAARRLLVAALAITPRERMIVVTVTETETTTAIAVIPEIVLAAQTLGMRITSPCDKFRCSDLF